MIMKKSNTMLSLVLLLGLAPNNPSFGQFVSNSGINSTSMPEGLKRELGNEIANRKAFENLKAMNVKMHKDFSRYYSTASDISTTTDKKHIMISCQVDGVQTRVNYYKNGHWASTLRFMRVNQLPSKLCNDILENYPGYKINRGKEVIVGPKSAYLIDLENEKSFKTIRVIDGEYDIYEQFLKQQNH